MVDTNQKKHILVILGPTATGKTRLAARVASQLGGEVISADSRQVYTGMDIGTGKDLEDYLIDEKQVPYHLIDIAPPGTEYNVFSYARDFQDAYRDISGRGKQVVVCGGTGMYLEAVTSGYDLVQVPRNEALREDLSVKTLEELVVMLKGLKTVHNITDTSDKERALRAIEIAVYEREHQSAREKRLPFVPVIFGVDLPRQLVRERITRRLTARLDEGMVEEVRGLLESGTTPEQLKFYGLEYRYVTQYIEGELNYNEMFRLLNTAIHQFAKRQMTWFRRMEKRGQQITWIDGLLPEEEKVRRVLDLYHARVQDNE